jgi:hypothetical protein
VQRKGPTKTYQSNGHAFSLVTRQRVSGTIQNLLETRKIELRRLLDEAPCGNTSPKCAKRIFDTLLCSRDATTDAIGSSSCSSIRASMREHLRGCDDLAVYGTCLDPMRTCEPQTSSRHTAQTEYQAPLIGARPQYQ